MKITLEFEVPNGVDPSYAEETLRDLVDVHEVEAALAEIMQDEAQQEGA